MNRLQIPRRAVCCAPLLRLFAALRYTVGRILNRASQKARKRESRRRGNRVIVELGEPERLEARNPENPKQEWNSFQAAYLSVGRQLIWRGRDAPAGRCRAGRHT